MADDTHVDELKKARSVLAKVRGDWVKAISAGYQRGKTEDAIKAIIEVQQAIDVIDFAMEEMEEAYEMDEDEE